MAFSFGSTATATPAFGSTPAPAPAFGATASPAPAAGGFSFGAATPAPAFGATPAPAFGAPAAGVPAPSIFGSAPAPATGSIFGSTPAPATGSIFGSTPAPATGSIFGSTPAPATGSFFGPALGQVPAQAAPPMMVTTSTPYSALPPEAKRAIDTIHEEIMRHKRTMANVETMAPALLREPLSPADAAAGYSNNNKTLRNQLKELEHHLQTVSQKLAECRTHALDLKKKCELSATHSVLYGVWQVEVLADRRGIQLSSKKKTTDPDVRTRLQKLLDLQVSHVDRVERIPGAFMWETLADLEQRVQTMLQQVSTLSRELEAACSQNDVVDIASIVHMQADSFARIAHAVTRVHGQMEQLRAKYHASVRGREDILLMAEMEERDRQTRLEQQAKFQFVKAAPASASAPGGFAGTTPAPAPGGGLFGSYPAPATTSAFGAAQPGGLFGAAPATGGGLFGSTPTAAPAFGSTPTSAPAFGAPAAPAGGLFGAAAPAASAPAFGSAPAAAPATTPAFGAAPATGLFGAPAPAPGVFSFAGTAAPVTTNTASTPRASGGSRSRNRSRR